MEKYIPLAALVAEIDKIIPQRTYERETLHSEFVRGQRVAYNRVLSILNTLEVKEVDLEKEIDKIWKTCNPIDEGMGCAYIDTVEFDIIAKHFFELGMKAANPLTVKDIEKIYHLVIEVSDDLGIRAMYVNIYQEALKRFKELKKNNYGNN